MNNINSEQKYKEKMKAIKNELLNFYSENMKYHYLWVTFNCSGMVVSVGKSSFKKSAINCGDLFYEYDLLGKGSQKIILQLLLEDDKNLKQALEKLNKRLNDYNYFAFILPITPEGINIVSKLETSLGSHLIKNGVQIINFYSHRYQ